MDSIPSFAVVSRLTCGYFHMFLYGTAETSGIMSEHRLWPLWTYSITDSIVVLMFEEKCPQLITSLGKEKWRLWNFNTCANSCCGTCVLGKVPTDQAILREIRTVCNRLPTMDSSKFKHDFLSVRHGLVTCFFVFC